MTALPFLTVNLLLNLDDALIVPIVYVFFIGHGVRGDFGTSGA